MFTLDQLKKRSRALASRWFLCGEGEETIDHLLLHCSTAIILWDLLLAIFWCQLSVSSFVKETLLSWHSSFVRKRRKKTWMVTPLCIFLDNLARKKHAFF